MKKVPKNWKTVPRSSGQVNSALLDVLALDSDDIKPRKKLFRVLEDFGGKTSMRHAAQRFEQYAMENAYENGEDAFLNNCEDVPKMHVPVNANIIRSNAIYNSR